MTLNRKLGHEAAGMSEADFLAAYRQRHYPRPSVSVDLAVFTVLDSDLKVLLIERGGHPFKGCKALPVGFVEVGDTFDNQGEDVDQAAHRELEEETRLPRGSCFLEQLYTFGRANRDPRTRVIGVAYFALVRPALAPMVTAGDDAASATWESVHGLADTRLAFDHAEVLAKAVTRIQGRIDYSPVAFELVPETFTVGELRAVYEAVKGGKYNRQNFYRRFGRMVTDGVIEPVTGKRETGHRPAKVYQFRRAGG